jgi:hypothetical protein
VKDLNMLNPVKIGDSVKVSLPGESPWAECIAVNPDGTWIGRIDNYLVAQAPEDQRREIAQEMFGSNTPLPVLHHYRCGDMLRFKPHEEVEVWVPDEGTSAARN